jgi:hypothetical protein
LIVDEGELGEDAQVLSVAPAYKFETMPDISMRRRWSAPPAMSSNR